MSESLNHLLAELHAERVRTWEPGLLKVNVEQRQKLVDDARHANFIKAGDTVAPFELQSVEGPGLDSEQLLADGPAALVFFRFAGCPACNIAIPYYERNLLPALRERNVPLVAVSPQVVERLVEIKARHNLTLQVASDKDNDLARRFGILYEVDETTRETYQAKGVSIAEITGIGTWELPQPTVLVIGTDRRVHFAQVSPDWLVRSEAQPIIEAVDELLGTSTATARSA